MTTDQPDSDRPTIDEFDRLSNQILGPVLERLGYSGERVDRRPLYLSKVYRSGEQLLKIYFEPLEYHIDISYMGPGMSKLQSLQFICRTLGRSIARYRLSTDAPLPQRLDSYATLLSEQVADVLSGTTVFRYTAADEEALVDQWDRAIEEVCSPLTQRLGERGFVPARRAPPSPEMVRLAADIRKRLAQGLAARGVEFRPREYEQFLLRRPMNGGQQSFELDIARRQGGPDFSPYVAVRHELLERIIYDVHPRGRDSKPTMRQDADSIRLNLYTLEFSGPKVISMEKPEDAPRVLQRLFDDFMRLGEPFLARVSTLEGIYEALRERANIEATFDHINRWDAMRVICLGLMLGKQAEAATAVRYDEKNAPDFAEFRARLRKHFPDTKTD